MNETANEAGARPGPGEDTSGQAGQKFRQESTQERLNKSKLRMETVSYTHLTLPTTS